MKLRFFGTVNFKYTVFDVSSFSGCVPQSIQNIGLRIYNKVYQSLQGELCMKCKKMNRVQLKEGSVSMAL
ncbi:tetracycline resistance efflux system leader peptide [Bacillus velezensis]|uniref:tetracycline resistance efflux system leader peptide n=1 Tax=Bacillus velezensis TaxID=492670 RepID=UPI0011230B86|nr:tetracycline resistance efflux system leader peptide [Bacillus velezensis]